MIVDVDEIKRHMKPKADSTLRNMKKDDLIAYIRTLEHNYNVAQSFLDQQARNFAEYVPAVNGRWIVDEDGNFCNVKCSVCGKDYACHYGMLQLQNFSFCPNCGAKMK